MTGWAKGVSLVALGGVLVVAVSYGLFSGLLYANVSHLFGRVRQYAPGDTVVAVYGAAMTFDAYGKMRSFAATAPSVLLWDAGDSDARVLAADPGDFAVAVGAGSYALALVPGALAAQTCPFWYNTSYDARGRPYACAGGAGPGQPLGVATLDAAGLVPLAQLPPFLYAGPTFLGYWNAALNLPFLDNATCGAADNFYYVVSDAGSVQLGPHSDWHPLDQAVCYNGTWDHVATAAFDELNGTPDQVAVTCVGRACTISLAQDIATNSTPTFAGLFVGLEGIVPASPSTGSQFHLPSNAGTAGQVYKRTATGAQWEDARLEAAVGVNGIQIAPINGTADAIGIDPAGAFTADAATLHQVVYSNAADTFSTTTAAASGLAQNTQLRWPPTNGAGGNVLVGDGAGNLAYGVNGAALAKYYATALASASGAAFTTLYGAGTGSLTIPANTLVANSGVRAVLACSHVSGVGTSTYRVVLGGTTLVTSPALANVASTPMHIEVTVWVPSAGTALVSGTIVRGSAISVFTQPSPVAFNPAVANAFNIQVAFSSTATASCRGFMRVAPDLF